MKSHTEHLNAFFLQGKQTRTRTGTKLTVAFVHFAFSLCVFCLQTFLPGKRDVRSENVGRTVKNNYLRALKISYAFSPSNTAPPPGSVGQCG